MRYVALHHWLMRTEAWLDLRTVPRCAYLFLASRYGGPGSNNGRIPCSLLEIAENLHVSKATAMRALAKLEDHGFVVRVKLGAFNFKIRHASEWRLTEFGCDVSGALPTKEFAAWRKSERGFTSNARWVPERNRSGSVMQQATEDNQRYGSRAKPIQPNDGFALRPLVVYQGGRAENEGHQSAIQAVECVAATVKPPYKGSA